MFLWLVSPTHVNEIGKRLAREKAVPSVRSKPNLHANIQKNMSPNTLYGLPEGTVRLKQDPGRVNAFIRRLTKGFLYKFEPDYDYFNDDFDTMPMQFGSSINLVSGLNHYERGNGVIDIWLGAIQKTNLRVAAFRFYCAGFLVCIHGRNMEKRIKLPSDYKEWDGLPKHL